MAAASETSTMKPCNPTIPSEREKWSRFMEKVMVQRPVVMNQRTGTIKGVFFFCFIGAPFLFDSMWL